MKMKEFYTHESKWTTQYLARDKRTKKRASMSKAMSCPENHCFCLLGALELCYNPYTHIDKHNTIRNKLFDEVGDIARFNDSPNTTFEDIKNLVEKLDI